MLAAVAIIIIVTIAANKIAVAVRAFRLVAQFLWMK
jgi:hypothetical protein